MQAMSYKLYAVYDADGSLSGELAYLAGKLMGVRDCALCDISHGWNPLGKTAWRAAHRNPSPRSFEIAWVHRDEQPTALSSVTQGALPAVVLQLNDHYQILLNKHELKACGGDYEKFEAALVEKLRA